MPKKRVQSRPEEQLVARIIRWSASYFITKDAGYEFIDDEGVTKLTGQIIEIDVRHREHLGQEFEISFVCERRFEEKEVRGCDPMLLQVAIRRNGRSLLSYLPADAYWALPRLLSQTADPCIEVAFAKLYRGAGEVRSIWMQPPRAAERAQGNRTATARKLSHLI